MTADVRWAQADDGHSQVKVEDSLPAHFVGQTVDSSVRASETVVKVH